MARQPEVPPPSSDPRPLNPDSELPPDADLDERFFDFWKRNGAAIFGGLLLATVIAVGYQAWQLWERKDREATAQAFLAAETPQEKLAFAERHADAPQAALAQLEAADAAYREGNFSVAASRYDALVESEEVLLAQRARLGYALARYYEGQTDEALRVLRQVADNPAAVSTIRAEAAYHLAVAMQAQNDIEGARQALDMILDLENASAWQQRGEALRRRFPTE